jgi:restriction system protein
MVFVIIGVLTIRYILIPLLIRFIKRKRFTKRGFKEVTQVPVRKLNQESEQRPESLTLSLIQDIEWKNFENLCCAYFIERGFDARKTQVGADGGVDIEVYKKGISKLLVIVQCKAYHSNVGVKDIREFYGVLAASEAINGIFLTTSNYTADALTFAKGKSPQLQLSSGERFVSLIKKLPNDAQDRLLKVAVHGDYRTPTCVKCDVKMVKRQGKRGSFFGCQNFPRCRVTMKVKV